MQKNAKHQKKREAKNVLQFKDSIKQQSLPSSSISDVKIPQFQYPDLNGVKISPREGQKFTISELISDAKPGTTINIPPGTYNESFLIDKPLKIVANGTVKIIGTDYEPIIRISSEGVSLRGFEFSHRFNQSESSAAIIIETGSALFLDCNIKSGSCPALKILNNSIVNVNSCKFISKNAPNLLSIGESCGSFELCNFQGSNSNGVVLRDQATVRFTRCILQGFTKSGVVTCNKSRVFMSKCRVTSCTQNGLELSSEGLCTIVDSSIEGCGNCAISAYKRSQLRLSSSTIEGCMSCGMEVREGAAARINGNVFSHCGSPSTLYAFEQATVDSLNDKFTSTGPLAVCALGNASIMMKQASFEDISGRGALVSDDATLNISESRFERTDETSITCTNGGAIILTKSFVLNSGELGMLISECHSAQITKTHIDSCALSGLEVNNVPTGITIEECNFTRCRQCGIVAISSSLEVSISNAIQNCFSGFEVRSSALSLHRCRSEENSSGGICARANSNVQIDTCIIQKNIQVGVSLESKSVMTISNSTIEDNKKLGIAVELESFLKLKSSIVTNHSCVAIQVEGKNSRAFLDKCDLVENDTGIICVIQGRVAIKSTTLEKNGIHIETRDKGQIKASGCNFTEAKDKASVNILEKSSASFEDCEFSNNSGIGVASEGDIQMKVCQIFNNNIGCFLYGSSTGSVSKCHIYKNGNCGVIIQEGAPKVNLNVIEDHKMYGISIDRIAQPMIDNNEFKNNRKEDIYRM